ncbi:DUF427 domain-containing protein [Microbacterium caowuchunii]|uniref:DUF427 domain-containing protein n=1 Tax=Microbacterium caowuchunii TaxID=2614638 RepID=UPI0012492441|nr:DUF427 domain-containing protein [Microbacterium caowuchunii]QEW01431.1 DUF427 domain-containing protein [Microbacterium caowuchunii]
MKARLDGVVVADAPDEDLVRIEGNWYFPPSSIVDGALNESPTPYTCPWKGECQYYNVVVDGRESADLAWAYPHPFPSAIDRVGADFSGYVAFAPGVQVS